MSKRKRDSTRGICSVCRKSVSVRLLASFADPPVVNSEDGDEVSNASACLNCRQLQDRPAKQKRVLAELQDSPTFTPAGTKVEVSRYQVFPG